MVKVKKDRTELETNLIDVILEIKTDKKKVKQIKDRLKPQKILAGEVQGWFKDPETEIRKLDDEKLYFLTEQVYLLTGSEVIDHREYFTPREVKEIKTTFEGYKSDAIKFPYTFKNAKKLHDGWYVPISVTELRLLNNGAEIQYNPNAQRSSKVKRTETGTLIPVPKLYPKSLEQIEDLFLRGKLISSLMVFNARLDTSDEDYEIYYDEDTEELTVTKGTMFDCLDGYHRFTATIRAQTKDPSKDMMFMAKIINTTEEGAASHFTQTNTFNVIQKAQKNKMDKERFENQVVGFLEDHSELKDKIVSDNTVAYRSNNLVSYSILSDAIADNFKMTTRGEAIKVSKFLKDFFNEICFAFPDEFLGEDIPAIKEKSLINANVMFLGYIVLARRFYEDGLAVSQVGEILQGINFDRSNKLWQELNVLDNKGSLTNSSKKGIVKFFEEIEL